MDILVVEDEPLIRWLVCDLLEEAGFLCTEAASAEHALMLLDKGQYRPDILVSDFNLGPGLDGKALSREVQRYLPGLPTIFVTGNPECFDEYPFRFWERLIAKPFAGPELVAAASALRQFVRDVRAPNPTLAADMLAASAAMARQKPGVNS